MSDRMPTLFLSHGSPMFAVEPGTVGPAWASLGRTLPRPRAVLMVSAHWETSVPMLSGSSRPETIHDFGGFPEVLYRITYPAPGAPALATRCAALLKAAGIAAGVDGSRGLDHGAWVPLRWMYPDADVPVVQLSVQPELGPAHHVRLGRALAPLTGDGVLIIASGHTTHNLRDWVGNARRPHELTYVRAFSEWLSTTLAAHDTEALEAYRELAPEAVRAHPTEEHFLPLFVAYGAAGDHARPERIVDGMVNGALSMDSYLFRPEPAPALA
jgi:4,5-DOPA dioxygenase extradiol